MKKSTKLVSAVVVLAVLGGVYVGLNTYVIQRRKDREQRRGKQNRSVFREKRMTLNP